MSAPLGAVIAHRGASIAAPENTLAAVRRAAAVGARWVECDVRLTADAVPVLLHDPTLERTTDGRGPLTAVRSADAARLDAGAWFGPTFAGEGVPTLAQTLNLAEAVGLGLNVELKAEGNAAARATAEAVAPLLHPWPGSLVVSSFNADAIGALRELIPKVPLGLLCGRRVGDDDLAVARELRCVSLHADRRAYDARLLARCENAGLWPVAYTVNEPWEARRLWGDGVRTLITDDPQRLLALAPC